MTEHLTKSQTERFCARALPEADLRSMGQHLADCEQCHHGFTERLRSRTPENLGFTLAPEYWFRHDHLDFDQLVSLADKTLDGSQREIIDLHLKACETCREDLRSFLAFRAKTSREVEVSYASVRQEPLASTSISRWRAPWSKPTYALVSVAIALIVIAIVVIVIRRRTEPLEAKQSEPNQILLPSPLPTTSITASNPSPSPSEGPENPTVVDSSLVATLKDGEREVTVHRSGLVNGLDDVPESSRREVADSLLAERIERPDILSEIAGQPGGVRGSNNAQKFRLVSPGRTVILNDRPIFKWEKVAGASSYRVFVGDLSGTESVKSDELPADQLAWRVPKSLKRDQVYSWNVVATVNGREIVSPDPASPEMKFKVLSSSELQKLEQLKKTNSHLSLGVAYAKAGLLPEAEKEFQILVQSNPRSQLPRRLLRSVRAMRSRN